MKNRRTKLTIDSAVQWAIVRRVLRHWICFLVMTAILMPLWLAVFSYDIVGTGCSLGEAVMTGWARTVPLIIFFVTIAPILVYDILKLSHRFVGPVYRLHKAIEDLAAGKEIPPIRLRRDDFWKNVIADFNTLAEQVTSMRKQETPSTSLEPTTCGASAAGECWKNAAT